MKRRRFGAAVCICRTYREGARLDNLGSGFDNGVPLGNGAKSTPGPRGQQEIQRSANVIRREGTHAPALLGLAWPDSRVGLARSRSRAGAGFSQQNDHDCGGGRARRRHRRHHAAICRRGVEEYRPDDRDRKPAGRRWRRRGRGRAERLAGRLHAADGRRSAVFVAARHGTHGLRSGEGLPRSLCCSGYPPWSWCRSTVRRKRWASCWLWEGPSRAVS